MFTKKSRVKKMVVSLGIAVLLFISMALPAVAANRGYVFSFSHTDYTYRTHNVPERILPYMWSMGYDAGEYTNNGVSPAYNVLPSSKAFVFLGDAVPGYVRFINSSGTTSDLYASRSTIASTDRSLSNLAAGSLTNTRTVIFMATFTGQTHANYGNLVDMAVAKGAQTSIGWNSSVDSTNEGADWLEAFFELSANGESVSVAITLADSEIRSTLTDALYQKVHDRHVAGALNTYLKITN